MKLNNIKTGIYLLLVFISMTSCVSPKKIAYFQNNQNSYPIIDSIQNYKIIVQPGDLLTINVSALDMDVAAPFNLYEATTNTVPRPLPYLVNTKGLINFPVIGKLKVGGLTTDTVTDNLTKLLSKYLKNPIVNIRITNLKVTVLGEVKKPGTYPIEGERISIFDAIGMAGDLTIQGKRSNIILLRKIDGINRYITLNISDKNIAYSPFYYLRQNDVLYVEPNKTKMNSSVVGPNSSIVISAISTLISLMAILKIF